MWLSRVFPTLAQPPSIAHARGDAAGALAATLTALPQAMACGVIAVSVLGPEWTGAGVIAGLLGSVVAGVVSVLLGSNPVVVAGPAAATVLVFAALLAQLMQVPGMTAAGALAHGCVAVVMAGVVQMLFGIFRFGRLSDFIPYPVVAGFLNASALLILLSQIGPLLGLGHGLSIIGLMHDLGQTQSETMALGLFTVAVIVGVGRMTKSFPPSLAGLALGTLVYHLAGLLGLGDRLGGTIPPLPTASSVGVIGLDAVKAALVGLDIDTIALLLPSALSIAVLSSLNAVLTVVAVDEATLQRSSPDRELQAQGAANVVSGMFGLLPSSGSIMRTTILYRAGGRSILAPLLTALMIAVVTLVLAPLVGLLPQAVVAALLVVVGFELFDTWTMGILRRLRKENLRHQPLADLFAVAIVVVAAVAFNLVVAVGVGVLVSVFFFIVRMTRSPVRRGYPVGVLEARVQGDQDRLAFIRRNADRVMILELEGTLFFGSVAALQRQVTDLVGRGIVHVVLDLKRVEDLDSTAARALERLHSMLERKGGLLVLAYVEPERRLPRKEVRWSPERRRGGKERRLWRVLDRTGSLSVLKPDSIQHDLDSALERCQRHIGLSGNGSFEDFIQSQPAILRGLNATQFRRLRPYLERKTVAAGDTIFSQGGPPDSIYFLASGRVEVSIGLHHTDRRMRIQTLTRGAIFGEMAVIDPQPRSATVSATVPSVLYRLSSQNFARLKVEQADIGFRLLENVAQIFAERLRASNVLVAQLEG